MSNNIDALYAEVYEAEANWNNAFKKYKEADNTLIRFIGSECKKHSIEYDPMRLLLDDRYKLDMAEQLKEIYEREIAEERKRDTAEALYDAKREGDL